VYPSNRFKSRCVTWTQCITTLCFALTRCGACVSQVYSPYFPQWLDGLQRCLSCCSLPILLCNGQNIAAYWLIGFPIINLWGARFMSVSSVFSVMAGWIAEILYMLFFASEYEANWLISVPLLNYWGARQLFFPAKRYTQIKQLKFLCFQKSKQTSIRKYL